MAQDMDASQIATSWTANDAPYVILKWRVENFSHVQNSLRSPCFEVGPTSKWNIVLEPRCHPCSGDDGYRLSDVDLDVDLDVDDSDVVDVEECVKISLRRNPNCTPDNKQIRINGELTVHGPKDELLLDRTFANVVLSNNSSVDFRIPRMLFLLPESPQLLPASASLHSPNSSLQSLSAPNQLHEDAYLIRCEMIVSCETTGTATNAWRLHLEKLSHDLKNLLLYGHFTDANVRAIDDIKYVHKAILQARSRVLSDILKVGKTVDAKDDISTHVGAVLLFAYTGNPDLLMSTVKVDSFGQIAMIAKRWQMDELENILTPVKMLCVTRMRYENFLYTWRIKNVTGPLFTSYDPMYSSEFVTNHQNQSGRVTSARWKLVLERSRGEDNLGLYLVKVDDNSNVSCKIDLEFRLFNDKSDVSVTKTREYPLGHRNSRQRCGFAAMCSATRARSRIVKDDTLNVACKMKFKLDPEESWIQKTAMCVDLTESDDSYSLKYMKTLSRNLKDLLESKACADLKVRNNNMIYPVHKAILCARSPYFSEILASTSPESISLPIDDDILRDILSYIYSAELPQLSLFKVQRLYEASFLLKLQEFQLACRFYVLQNITVHNVLEIMAMAHTCNDKDLELAAAKFASVPANAKMIITTTKWSYFRSKYPEFAIRIYHNLCVTFLGL